MGMAVSVLAHLFVFFCFGLLTLRHTALPKETTVSSLNVRLAQQSSKIEPPKPVKKLQSARTPAQYKFAQAVIQNPPASVPQPTARAVKKLPTPADSITGVAFPGSVATPWSGQPGASNSIFHAPSLQQDAARIAYQQAIDAQAMQQSEQHAQHIMVQLHQLLSRLLDVHPVATGTCALAGTDRAVVKHLVCVSPALNEALSKDEKTVAGMLAALRETGKMLNGFSVEMRADKPEIMLTYKE